jgi:hypothetical protein
LLLQNEKGQVNTDRLSNAALMTALVSNTNRGLGMEHHALLSCPIPAQFFQAIGRWEAP